MLESLPHLRFTTPLVTPFGRREGVQSDRIAELVRRQKTAGADAVLVASPLGEGDTLSSDERGMLAQTAVKTARDVDIAVLVDISAPSVRAAVIAAEHAMSIGADALVMALPSLRSYDTVTCGLVVNEIARAMNLPLVIRAPDTKTFCLSLEVVNQLARVPIVQGCITDDLEEALRLRNETPLTVLMASDFLIGPSLLAGISGIVSPVANLVPESIARIVRASMIGNIDEVRSAQRWITGLCDLIGTELVVPRMKAALQLLGIPVGIGRLPIRELTDLEIEALRAALRQWGIGVS